MAIVVDDHLLLDLLADDPNEWLGAETEHSAVYTTAAWYYRLANAAHRGTGKGELSRRLAERTESFRSERIDSLPDRIGLVGPRLLVPVMASLVTRRRPNVLTAEALAVALVTDTARWSCRSMGHSSGPGPATSASSTGSLVHRRSLAVAEPAGSDVAAVERRAEADASTGVLHAAIPFGSS